MATAIKPKPKAKKEDRVVTRQILLGSITREEFYAILHQQAKKEYGY